MSEIYIATAIETDGPAPGMCSILSLASAAYQRDRTLVSTFSVNLETLPGAGGDPATVAWWKSKPNAWSVCRHEPEPAGLAIPEYVAWLDDLPGRPVYVGYPAAAGYAFVSWYLHRFAKRNPFGRGALDLRTMSMVLLGRPYHQSKMRSMPAAWTHDSPPRTYVALDDALSTGRLLCHMLEAVTALHRDGKIETPTAPGTVLRLKEDEA